MMGEEENVLIILLLNILFSLVFIFAKFAMTGCPPFFLVGLRALLGGGILVSYAILIKKIPLPRINKNLAVNLTLLAIFNIYLANSFEFWGLQYMTAAKTCFIYNLGPFFSALFSYLYFKETMSSRKWLGIFVTFFAFIPVLIEETNGESLLRHILFFSEAELALLIATVAFVYGWTVMQHIIRSKQCDIFWANGLSMLGGSMLAFSHSYCIETWNPIPIINWWPFLIWLLLITLIANVLCYPLYTHALNKYTATFLAISGLIAPVFAAFFDYIFFGVIATGSFWLAMCMVCVGFYIFYREEITLADLLQ